MICQADFQREFSERLKDGFLLLFLPFLFVHGEEEDATDDKKGEDGEDAGLDASGDGDQDSIDQRSEDRGKLS